MADQLDKYSEEELVQKRVPGVSLKLDYVYGFEAFDRRRTLFYVHNHSVVDFQTTVSPETLASLKNPNHQGNKNPSDQYDTKFLSLPQNYLKEMLFSKYQAIPYDVHHKQCERKYIHFVSRIAVISSSVNNSQQFYEGHSRKISSMCMHPSKMIVATAEAGEYPSIHIWSVIDLAPLSVFKTQHENGVINMRFSFDGFF